MELRDGHVWIAIIGLLAILGLSLYTIFDFMPTVERCEPVFQIINECGCIPDQKIADLFGITDYMAPLNVSEVLDGR